MGPPPDTHAVYELPSGGPLVASLDVQGNQSPDPSSCATQPPLRGFYRQSLLRERAHCHAVQALSRPVSHLSSSFDRRSPSPLPHKLRSRSRRVSHSLSLRPLEVSQFLMMSLDILIV